MQRKILKNKYPWRDGHAARLLVDGGQFFDAMLADIDRATRSLHLCMYLVRPGGCVDRWGRHLAAAASRGVKIRILADGFGAFAARGWLRELRSHGIELRWFNPLDARRLSLGICRDHRKMLIVDDAIGYVGGFCLTDDFDPRHRAAPWHDVAIRIEGPCVADLLRDFRRDWVLYGGQPFEIGTPRAAGGQRCRVARNHPRGVREVRRSALRRLRHARERAWLVTPYFAPSRRLLRELTRAARRGVDVRLLLSGPETDQGLVRSAAWRFYRRLIRSGVQIVEYRGRALHAKVLLVDDWASCGSCNLDHWGLRWNRDLNLEAAHGPLPVSLADLLRSDLAHGDRISLSDLEQRPLWQRAWQTVASLVEIQLVRYAYRRQLHLIRRHPGRPRAG